MHCAKIAQELNVPQQKILLVSSLSPLPPLSHDIHYLIFWCIGREAMEHLEAEGLVYTSIDEFHYRSTVNG